MNWQEDLCLDWLDLIYFVWELMLHTKSLYHVYMPSMFHAANFYKYLDLNAIAFCLSLNMCVFVCNWQLKQQLKPLTVKTEHKTLKHSN